MNTMLRSTLFIFVLLFTLSSCIKTVRDKDLPTPENLLVIGGFIAPTDSVIHIHVGKTGSPSNQFNMGGGNSIKDATVILSGDGASATLSFDDVSGSYIIPSEQFPIVPGNTYFLSVSTPDGLVATSQTTVPEQANASLDFTLDSITTQQYGYPQKELILDVSWTDIPGEANYYRLHGRYHSDNKSPNNGSYYYNSSQIYFGSMYQSEYVISDKAADGGLVGPVFGQAYIYGTNSPEAHVKVRLLTVDKNYYDYYSSLWNVNQDDPFSEPQNIFTNIEGGLGVFCSYQEYVVRKDL